MAKFVAGSDHQREALARSHAAYRARVAEQRRHGTTAMYRTERCRCDECLLGERKRQRYYRARKRGVQPTVAKTWRVSAL
jgi:hypothetical protein